MAHRNADKMPLSPELARLEELVQKAQQDDLEAVADLRRLLEECPQLPYVADDMAMWAENALIGLIAGKDAQLAHRVRRTLDRLKKRLSRPGQSDLEELIATRIAICWLNLRHAEHVCSSPAEVYAKQSQFFRGRSRVARTRLKRAVRALAVVRQRLT